LDCGDLINLKPPKVGILGEQILLVGILEGTSVMVDVVRMGGKALVWQGISRDGCVYQVICGTVPAGGSGAPQAGECRQPADALGNAALLRVARHWHGAGLILPCLSVGGGGVLENATPG